MQSLSLLYDSFVCNVLIRRTPDCNFQYDFFKNNWWLWKNYFLFSNFSDISNYSFQVEMVFRTIFHYTDYASFYPNFDGVDPNAIQEYSMVICIRVLKGHWVWQFANLMLLIYNLQPLQKVINICIEIVHLRWWGLYVISKIDAIGGLNSYRICIQKTFRWGQRNRLKPKITWKFLTIAFSRRPLLL